MPALHQACGAALLRAEQAKGEPTVGAFHKLAIDSGIDPIDSSQPVIVALVATINTSLRKGDTLIDWRVVVIAAIAAALAAWFGTDLMHKLSNQHLTRLFGAVLLVFAIKMLLVK